MLFNWIECNNYSITIGPEKRKILAEYCSRSDDPNSRAVQNTFRGLTKCGLLVGVRVTIAPIGTKLKFNLVSSSSFNVSLATTDNFFS